MSRVQVSQRACKSQRLSREPVFDLHAKQDNAISSDTETNLAAAATAGRLIYSAPLGAIDPRREPSAR